MSDWTDDISDNQWRVLEDNDFDPDRFESLLEAYIAGELSEEANRIDAGRLSPPREGDIDLYPGLRGKASQYRELGLEAIDRGEVGLLVLNGGMATRFGGVVKGTVEISEGRSFLGVKCEDAKRFDADVPVILMNSFATHADTADHFEENKNFGLEDERVIPFKQGINLRVTKDGDLYRNGAGEVSMYAPGHGDLAEYIQRGALQRFIEGGGKYLLMSNVDNLLATLDPAVVGHHIAQSTERNLDMTVEVARRSPNDTGGLVARIDDNPQVVEYFRFPEEFDDSQLSVFNTNTFLFNAEALQDDFDLDWFAVNKTVNGDEVVQFERLAGQLSKFLDTSFLMVPSEGRESRYHPIKRPEDLQKHRDELLSILEERLSR